MFKFKLGDTVKKSSGYTFIGRVVSAYTVESGNRYDVQVDSTIALTRLKILMKDKEVSMTTATALIEVEDLMKNCDGMIHIFAEDQLEKM